MSGPSKKVLMRARVGKRLVVRKEKNDAIYRAVTPILASENDNSETCASEEDSDDYG